MRSTAKEWAERVRAWRESGQPATAFAGGKGFSDKTLMVTVGAVRVEVRSGFDVALLRELVDALGEAR